MRNQKRSFTLIELLVVIALVGLIFGIVLVALSSARDKARRAAALQFAASVYHALGAEAVGIWDFDEGSGTTATDTSGYGNNGTLTNGPVWRCASSNPNYTPSGGGCSLQFDGNNDYVNLGNPVSLRLTGNQTIEMWLYPTSFGARRNPYAKAYGGEGTITQETDGRVSYYYGTCGGNCSPYTSISMTSNLSLNTWAHLVLVRDLANMKLYWYKNGTLVNQTNASYASATASSNSAMIGRGYVSNYAGRIDGVRIYGEVFSSAQVQQLYAEGVGEHGLVAK